MCLKLTEALGDAEAEEARMEELRGLTGAAMVGARPEVAARRYRKHLRIIMEANAGYFSGMEAEAQQQQRQQQHDGPTDRDET